MATPPLEREVVDFLLRDSRVLARIIFSDRDRTPAVKIFMGTPRLSRLMERHPGRENYSVLGREV